MTVPAPAPLTRKDHVQDDVKRWQSMEVVSVNKPNPVLMGMAAEEIFASNMRRLENNQK